MHNSNIIGQATPSSSKLLIAPGVEVFVSKDSTLDYLQMRAAQLSALNHLLTSADFESWDDTIKADAKWLAATLASEVSQLATVVTIGEISK